MQGCCGTSQLLLLPLLYISDMLCWNFQWVTDLECCCHMCDHKHVGHGHHPVCRAALKGHQDVVSNVCAKGVEAHDGHTKVAQALEKQG